MSRLNAANNAQSLLDGGISDTDVSMTVLDGSIFPEPPFLVTVEDEIIEVRAKTGNVFGSLLRGQEGTVAVAHADGVEVQNRMTVGMYDSLALGEDISAIAQELNAHKADNTPHEGYVVQKSGDTMTGKLTIDRASQVIADTQLALINSLPGNYGIGVSFKSVRGDTQAVVEAAKITVDGESSWAGDAAVSSNIRFYTINASLLSEKARLTAGGTWRPGVDNTQNLGSAEIRWAVVYAGTGTINTSDQNEKEQITDLSEAEKRVATAIKGLVRRFKFRDAVTAKGDAARYHFGVIAQEVRAAFTAEGLDAHRYGLFCEDTWYELDGETVSAETTGAVERKRLGIRYDELLAFMIASL